MIALVLLCVAFGRRRDGGSHVPKRLRMKTLRFCLIFALDLSAQVLIKDSFFRRASDSKAPFVKWCVESRDAPYESCSQI
jgi:hypothetical protein